MKSVFEADEVTGQHDGDELRTLRAKRSTGERLERLEVKHDELVKKVDDHRDAADRRHDSLVKTVGEMRGTLGEMSGKLEVLPELVGIVRDVAKQSSQREHITLTAQVDVDKARALDQIDARKMSRGNLAKIIGGAVTLLTSGAFVHWLLGRI